MNFEDIPRPDIICLGTGRSGTSFVAKVLAEHLNVCWGQLVDPRPLGGAMKSGKWEDRNMKSWDKALAMLKITPEEWIWQWHKAHGKCRKAGGERLHGVKDPFLSHCPPMVWEHITPGLIINCKRSYKQVVASRKKYAAWRSVEYWKWHTLVAEHQLADLARWAGETGQPYVEIDLSYERTAEEVLEEVRHALPV
jgi:hypothetical protein